MELPSERERSALTWIVVGPAAWTPALGWAIRVGAALAQSLVDADLAVVWDEDDEGRPFVEPMVTLTPWGACRLAVEVEELRWQPAGWRGRKPRQHPERFLASLPRPELVEDHRPGPLEELIDLEAWSEIAGAPVAVAEAGSLAPGTPGGVGGLPAGAACLVDAATGAVVTIAGAPVQVGRPRRAG